MAENRASGRAAGNDPATGFLFYRRAGLSANAPGYMREKFEAA